MQNAFTQAVQSKYASLAKSGLSTGHSGVRAVAENLSEAAHSAAFSGTVPNLFEPGRHAVSCRHRSSNDGPRRGTPCAP